MFGMPSMVEVPQEVGLEVKSKSGSISNSQPCLVFEPEWRRRALEAVALLLFLRRLTISCTIQLSSTHPAESEGGKVAFLLHCNQKRKDRIESKTSERGVCWGGGWLGAGCSLEAELALWEELWSGRWREGDMRRLSLAGIEHVMRWKRKEGYVEELPMKHNLCTCCFARFPFVLL